MDMRIQLHAQIASPLPFNSKLTVCRTYQRKKEKKEKERERRENEKERERKRTCEKERK
jgi:hypothetical protein